MNQAIIEDRRHDPQISLAVITHMEERLTAHALLMERKFDGHTREEMIRFDDIAEKYTEVLALISQSNTDHNERHKHLLQSVEAHMAKSEDIYTAFMQAFPTDKKGKPDFAGHQMAHEKWIENSTETKELMAYVKKVVLAAAATALVSWVTFLIWNGVLHGPVK